MEQPVLPDGFRFRTADEAGPEAAVQAHVDAWAPSTYTAEGYQGVRQTAAYRGDLHILVEAPDGTMASSTIMWLDEANKTAEFEPVGTHPGYRRLGLARAMLLHGMHLARAAGATHMTVACLGAPGHPEARGLYYSVGFRELSRDAPLIKTKTAAEDWSFDVATGRTLPDTALDVRYSRSSSRFSRMIASASWPWISKIPSTGSRQLAASPGPPLRSGRWPRTGPPRSRRPAGGAAARTSRWRRLPRSRPALLQGRGLREACTAPFGPRCS